MKRRLTLPGITGLAIIAIATWIAFLTGSPASAEQRVVLKSGIPLEGLLAEIATLNQNPFQAGGQGQPKSRPILLVDDGLRRVYVHERGMVSGPPLGP